MEYNMLENSLIYLLDTAIRLNESEPDKCSVKYSIVHLYRGMKLLLKKRLFDEHWSLVYKDTSGIIPIDFFELKNRLFRICNIDIDEYNEIISKIRNDYKNVELYQFTKSTIQMRSNLVQIWSFIVDFISKYIDISNDTYATNLFDQTCEEMDFHLEYIRNRKIEVKNVLSNKVKESYYAEPLKCPECLQPAVPLLLDTNGQFTCEFCDYVVHWKEFVTDCASIFNYSGPFHCPRCHFEGVIQKEEQRICLYCCNALDADQGDFINP